MFKVSIDCVLFLESDNNPYSTEISTDYVGLMCDNMSFLDLENDLKSYFNQKVTFDKKNIKYKYADIYGQTTNNSVGVTMIDDHVPYIRNSSNKSYFVVNDNTSLIKYIGSVDRIKVEGNDTYFFKANVVFEINEDLHVSTDEKKTIVTIVGDKVIDVANDVKDGVMFAAKGTKKLSIATVASVRKIGKFLINKAKKQ
jgi:hypothetical protein